MNVFHTIVAISACLVGQLGLILLAALLSKSRLLLLLLICSIIYDCACLLLRGVNHLSVRLLRHYGDGTLLIILLSGIILLNILLRLLFRVDEARSIAC